MSSTLAADGKVVAPEQDDGLSDGNLSMFDALGLVGVVARAALEEASSINR